MYGAKPIGSFYGLSDSLVERNAGGTFAKYDTVNHSSGELIIADATDTIFGVAMEAATSASTGVQVNVTLGLMVIMDNDNDTTTFAATHVGTMFDQIGATGAILVDTNTTSTSGQFYCLEYNPQGFGLDSDTSIGKFMLNEREFGI
jgi:hypothetical protein